MKEKSAKLFFKLLKVLSYILPPFLKDKIAKFIAYTFYRFHKRYYKVAKVNLDFIYGDSLSSSQKEEIIKGVFLNLAYNLGSLIENQNIKKDKLLKKVTFKNEKILLNAIKQQRPVVLITAHQSNWEILSLAISAKFKPLVIVGRPLKQEWLNSALKNSREQFGTKLISKKGGMRAMLKVAKEKKILGLLVDQNLPGESVEFFGKKASHTTAAALLARKYNAIVIPCFTKRVGFEKYEAVFCKPIEIEKSNDFMKDILIHTQKQAKITEEFIRKNPHEWLWIHRRWKKFYPEIYK